MTFDTLIHNATIVTADEQMRVTDHGWLGIAKGRIAAVALHTSGDPLPAAGTTIDAAGGILMPGLVNTHTHLPMTLFRGLADDLPLMTWLNEHIFPAEAQFVTPENVHWGTLLACAEMLLAGTTCCCGGYFHEHSVAQAVQQAGLRAVLGQGVIDFPAPGVPDPNQNIAHAVEYARHWQGRSKRIIPSIFCHAPYTCSDETLTAAKAAADELGLIFQTHAAETQFERDQSIQEKGVSPVAHLERLGILDANTLLAHGVWTDEADHEILARRGCAIAHCPESNMKLGSGIAPVRPLKKAGVTVGLGTDGCASNNDLDLFGEMATAAKLHKVINGDPTALDAATVLRMATIDGARAMGLEDQIGSLDVGKQADLIVLETRAAHLTPVYHPISHIVYAASGADVRHVFIGGEQVVKDRQVTTLDVGEVMGQVKQIAEKIYAQNSFKC